MLIKTEADRSEALQLIANLNIESPQMLEVKPYVADRSKAQNRLYYMWLTEMAKHLEGSTGTIHDVETISEMMKETIYPLIECEKQLIFPYTIKFKGVKQDRVRYLSSASLGVIIMGLYLNALEMWCATRIDLRLTLPVDLMAESLGRVK